MCMGLNTIVGQVKHTHVPVVNQQGFGNTLYSLRIRHTSGDTKLLASDIISSTREEVLKYLCLRGCLLDL